jgi:hypothetical protein
MNRQKILRQILIFNIYFFIFYIIFFDNYTDGKVLTIIGLTLFSALLQLLLIAIDLVKLWNEPKLRLTNIILVLIIPLLFLIYISILVNI